jgi:hypothetical protein
MSTKEAAKPLQECVKETETIELYFQQGSSDKVYHLQLESVEEQWSVNAQWGRRGSALQSDAKVSSVAYEEAKRVYDQSFEKRQARVIESCRQLPTAILPFPLDCLPSKSIPVTRRNY